MRPNKLIAVMAVAVVVLVAASTPGARADDEPASASGRFVRVPGHAFDIGVGGGVTWVIGFDDAPGGFQVYRFDGAEWQAVAGGGVRISVGPQGDAWVVNSSGALYHWQGAAFARVANTPPADDIGVGPDGKLWMTGRATPGENGPIYHFNGTRWDRMPGAGTSIDVGWDNSAWLTNAAGSIYRWNGANWVIQPGKAGDVGVGSDGSVWVVGTGDDGGLNSWVYEWDAGRWVRRNGKARFAIDVDANGGAWIVNVNFEIYRWVEPGTPPPPPLP
jgi:hypothetical protein